MTFKELQEEVWNSGFSDLQDGGTQETRVKRWLNTAYGEIADYAAWPFLEATKEGKAPLTIEDIGHVLSVVDSTNENQLFPVDRRELISADPKLAETGSAVRWYVETETSLKVWPADTSSTFIVRYLKVPVELKEATDKPIIPTRFHELIVRGALIRAYENRDGYEAGREQRADWERGMRQMVGALLAVNYDRAPLTRRVGWAFDYL